MKEKYLILLATPREGTIDVDYDKANQVITGENYVQLPSSYLIKRFGVPKGNRSCLLLMTDLTKNIRRKYWIYSKKENIHATFFVVGINAENNH